MPYPTKADPFNLAIRLRGMKMKYTEMICLDLGCGRNESPISKKVLEIPWSTLVSVDVWPHNINRLHAKRAAGEIAASNWISYCEPMEVLVPRLTGNFHVVLMLDSLEHIEKGAGLRFLADVEALKPKRVLMWIPLGNCPQGPLEGNPNEVHKSTWEKEELEALGYEVQVFPAFHKHLVPNVDAAWASKNLK